jgi:hypothetical protein
VDVTASSRKTSSLLDTTIFFNETFWMMLLIQILQVENLVFFLKKTSVYIFAQSSINMKVACEERWKVACEERWSV